MSTSRVAQEPVAPYVARPPEWLKRVHTTADLGYIGFYPPVPNAQEEQLTRKNVQEGYSLQPDVNAESFNAKQPVVDAFAIETTLDELKQLMDAVAERRAENAAKIKPYSFKIPGRVTFNDQRRVGWVKELANSEVPLHRIGKNVPHGFKGHDLLDMLQSNRVAINRAVWYVRVLGANETQGMRNRPNFHPAMYSVEWATVVTSYIKKLLSEIALPSAPRAALNIKQTFKSTLAEPSSREKWLSRFTYCLELLHEFYVEGLVDPGTFLSCVAQQMAASNLAQAGFLICILEDYLDGLLGHRAFTRPLIEGCLGKLSEIDASPVKEHLLFLSSAIKAVLQRALPIVPDAFVSPGIWSTHAVILRELFGNQEEFFDIERRNEALTFRALPVRAMASVSKMMSDIQVLNSVTMNTDLVALARRRPLPLSLLLTWAASPAQHGVHRPYLVATLLAKSTEYGDYDALQNALVEWLEGDAPARGAARLLGELGRTGLFSYERFLQRIMVHGEASRYHDTLREMPVWNENSVVLRQRKIALYGMRAASRETEEDRIQRDIRAEIRQQVPNFFGGVLPDIEPTGTFKSRMPTLFAAHKFEQVRVAAHWLMPLTMSYMSKCDGSDLATCIGSYSIVSELLSSTHCFSSLCDLNISMLKKVTSPEVLMAVVSNVRRFAFIFKCMDVLPILDQALAVAHQSLRSRPAQLRSLLALLQVINRGEQSESGTLQLVAADVDASVQALRPPITSPEDMISLDVELAQLAADPAPNAPSILAHALWTNFKTKSNWGLAAAESTFASLYQLNDVYPQDVATKFAAFLWEVDQLLAGDLDAHLLECFRGPVFCTDELRTADEAVWSVVSSILVELVARGCVCMQTVLSGIIYPAWSLGAQLSTGEESDTFQSFLLASVKIGRNLLICTRVPEDDGPPRSLLESQQLKARRAMLYDDGNFSDLVTALRSLVAWETSPNERIKDAARSLRTALQVNREFWFIARKNLDLVRDVFLTVLQPSEPLVEMLRSILGDPASASADQEEEVAPTDWQNISSRVNPWTFARTSINLHLTLQELVKGLRDDDTRAKAEQDLDTFTAGLFDSAVTSEETDLLADVLRGISGPIVAKFVNNGMRRLAQLTDEFADDDMQAGTVDSYLLRTGEVLRLLAAVIVPLREDPGKLPRVDVPEQDALVRALHTKFSILDERLPQNVQSVQALQMIIFLCRILQLLLGLAHPWSDAFKTMGPDVIRRLVNLSVACGGGVLIDLRTFTILLDTISMMFEEFPKDPKTASTDLFQAVSSVDPDQLPATLPESIRKRLLLVLPYRPNNPYVAGLVHMDMEAEQLALGASVQHRPWEWLENTEPRDGLEADGDAEGAANACALPLELFCARPTAERAVYGAAEREGDVVLQQDALAGGSVFEHDWRQSRVPAWQPADTDAPSPEPPAPVPGGDPSPAAADPFHAPSHSQSPADAQVGTISSSARGSKRKASTAASSAVEDDPGSSAHPGRASASAAPAAKRARVRAPPAAATATTAAPKTRARKK